MLGNVLNEPSSASVPYQCCEAVLSVEYQFSIYIASLTIWVPTNDQSTALNLNLFAQLGTVDLRPVLPVYSISLLTTTLARFRSSDVDWNSQCPMIIIPYNTPEAVSNPTDSKVSATFLPENHFPLDNMLLLNFSMNILKHSA